MPCRFRKVANTPWVRRRLLEPVWIIVVARIRQASIHGLRRPARPGVLVSEPLGDVQCSLDCRCPRPITESRAGIRACARRWHYTEGRPESDAVRLEQRTPHPQTLGALCILPIRCGWKSVDRACKIDPVPGLVGSRLGIVRRIRSGNNKKESNDVIPLGLLLRVPGMRFQLSGAEDVQPAGRLTLGIPFAQQ